MKYTKIVKITVVLATIILGGLFSYALAANNQIKTQEIFIGSSDALLVSGISTSTPFSFYIGDNFTGITNPVKSLYFTISGVYTGSGTLAVTIDSDNTTLQTFTLPSNASGNPTPFELIYKDPTNKINPQSSGAYSYTLNVTPSGPTIYGLGETMTESHQYAPPACGGMPVLGDLISAVFDSTGRSDGGGYSSVMWQGALGGPGSNEGKVLFQFAGATDSAGPWTYYGPVCVGGNADWFDPSTINLASANTPIELIGTGVNAGTCRTSWNNKQYFRYKIRICSNDCTSAGTYTPTVSDVVVNWTP